MAVQVKLKRWGNSMGIVLPRDFIDRKNLREDDSIFIEVTKKADLSKLFGSLKKGKMSGQEFKDMVREGWKK